MTIYLKKKIKTLPGRNLHLVRLIIETFTINEKKIEKLGLGTLKNCMIYRRSDTHKIWIWNGFVIIRLLQQRGGGDEHQCSAANLMNVPYSSSYDHRSGLRAPEFGFRVFPVVPIPVCQWLQLVPLGPYVLWTSLRN